MTRENHPCPAWIVASAGTGGTLATIGRYVHYCRHDTRVCGVDAEHSVFFDHYVSGDATLTLDRGSRIEGIGRPRVEASFVPGVLDAMVKVPDVWSLAAMHSLERAPGPACRRLHRHQPDRRAGLCAEPEGERAGRLDRHAAVRRRQRYR